MLLGGAKNEHFSYFHSSCQLELKKPELYECSFRKHFTSSMHHAAWSLFKYPHLMNFSHHSTVQMDFFLAEMRQTTAKHTGPLTYWGG